MKIKNYLWFVFLTLPVYFYVQEQDDEKSFSLSAQIRSRADYRKGVFFPAH